MRIGMGVGLTFGRTASAALWSPQTDAATYPILAWWRADNPANTFGASNTYTQLTDKSANARNLVQSNFGNRATLISAASPSGRDVARFDGTDDVMLGSPFLFSSATAYTIFAAIKSVGTANGHLLTEGNDGNDIPFFKVIGVNGTSNGVNTVHRNNANALPFNAEFGMNPWGSAWNVIAVTDSLTTATGYVNNVAGSTPVTTTRVGATTLTNIAMGIWKRTGVIQPLAMDFGEMLIVQGVADSTYRGNAYAYLKREWGTT